MGAKKDEYRFTIQFNSMDSKHQQVAEILNRQGRRKAQYLVNAVLSYENKVTTAQGVPPLPSYHAIETIVNQILADKAIISNRSLELSGTEPKKNLKKAEEIKIFEDTTQELAKDELVAIANSIAAFRSK